MYTRSYGTGVDGQVTLPPENYDGTAFNMPENVENRDTGEVFSQNFTDESEQASARPRHSESKDEGLFSFLSRVPLIGGLFSEDKRSCGFLSGIGTEELLIIGIALFLLLSKDGDTECALMLLLLLFIKD